jgi:Domain of unknown function (DUF4372)/Transposase DDE domain
MHAGKFVFAQLMELLPWKRFQRLVIKYAGDRYVKHFSCTNQFLCMAFAQLTYRESLRDIEACLRAHSTKLYHLGIRARISRSTLADANELRDWRIYAEFAQALIAKARPMYANDSLEVDLASTVYALDSTLIELCLSVFPWASYRPNDSAVKLHTLLDLRGSIPSFLYVSDGKASDLILLDQLIPEPGAFYVMDRGFIDYARLYRFHEHGAFFVVRAKSNLNARRRYSHPVDRSSGLRSDQTIILNNFYAHKGFPHPLRRVRIKDLDTGTSLVVLTNNFALPALTVTSLYRCRWQIELFFKWIKQHLRIKAFFGTSENAVKTQIWIAVAAYVLVAIAKKRFKLDASLHELLQILSVTLFERDPLDQVLTYGLDQRPPLEHANQLALFEF